jgi:16S rRNA (cytosine967-C5)-methyltransferase
MTPSARVQAAIEILDEAIASAIGDGPPADMIVQRYFKTRRYAGSKDRRAVRELVYRAIRRSGERPDSGRSAMLGVADEDDELNALFDGSVHGPAERSFCLHGLSLIFPSSSLRTNGLRCLSARRST